MGDVGDDWVDVQNASYHSRRSSLAGSRRIHKDRLSINEVALLLNLSDYVKEHGHLFSSGTRWVPLTTSMLEVFVSKVPETKDKDFTRRRRRWFQRETPEDKERKALGQLARCFREGVKLRLSGGSGQRSSGHSSPSRSPARENSTPFFSSPSHVDLYHFDSLTHIEFSDCQLDSLLNVPLGITHVTLRNSSVPISKLGEAVTTVKISHSPQLHLPELHALAPSVTSLSVKDSLVPPASLANIITTGASEVTWPRLRFFAASHNSLGYMDPSLAALGAVEEVNLSYNAIPHIQHLANCSCLTSLDLSHNSISSVADVQLSLPPSLTSLNLSANLLVSVEGLSALAGLKVLDIGDNNLRHWQEVVELLASLEQLESFRLKGNPTLFGVLQNQSLTRPLIAGMVPPKRWKTFVLDGKHFSDVDTDMSRVKAAAKRYHFVFPVKGGDAGNVQVMDDSMLSSRTRLVDFSPVAAICHGAAAEACAAAGILLLAFASTTLVLLPLSWGSVGGSTTAPSSPTEKSKKKKVKVIKRTVVYKKKKDDRGEDTKSEENVTWMSDTMGTTASQRQRFAIGSGEWDSKGWPDLTRESASEDTEVNEDVDEGVAKWDEELALDDPDVLVSTHSSWRLLVATIADALTGMLEVGTVRPVLKRIHPRKNRWGHVERKGSPIACQPYIVSFVPSTAPSPPTNYSYCISVEASTAPNFRIVRLKSKSATIPLGSGVSPARFSQTPPCRSPANSLPPSGTPNIGSYMHDGNDSDMVSQPSGSEHGGMGSRYSITRHRVASGMFDGAAAWPNPRGVLTPDDEGFVVKYIEVYRGYGGPGRAEAVTLCNVQTCEPGEPRKWDPKQVVVQESINSQTGVTDFQGTTYLDREQQGLLRASVHHVSDPVLLTVFHFPEPGCLNFTLKFLEQHLRSCHTAPQWPLITAPVGGAASSSDLSSFTFGNPPFATELGSCRMRLEEFRAGSTSQTTESDFFMLFGTTIAGSRMPSTTMLELFDIKLGLHIVAPEAQAQVATTQTNEQLVGCCFCNVVLGGGNEQEEKSCLIATSESNTYLLLDATYNTQSTGDKINQLRTFKNLDLKAALRDLKDTPFVFLACHRNADLEKIDLGYNLQYMRFYFGGESGQTYLLLPRCRKSALHTLSMFTASRTTKPEARIYVHKSPFEDRPLVPGQGAVVGYYLVYMQRDHLIQYKGKKEAGSLSYPQEIFPLSNLPTPYLPVSIVLTKQEILIVTDRYAIWPDNETGSAGAKEAASRWHLEKKACLGDVVSAAVAEPGTGVFPSRFSLSFEQEDESLKEYKFRWNFCAQTESAVNDIIGTIARETERLWTSPLAIENLMYEEEPMVKRRKK